MYWNLPNCNLQEELTLEAFLFMLKIIFENHTPLKNIYLRANCSKLVTKGLSKTRKLRSILKWKFLKDRTEELKCEYKKKKREKDYFLKIVT